MQIHICFWLLFLHFISDIVYFVEIDLRLHKRKLHTNILVSVFIFYLKQCYLGYRKPNSLA